MTCQHQPVYPIGNGDGLKLRAKAVSVRFRLLAYTHHTILWSAFERLSFLLNSKNEEVRFFHTASVVAWGQSIFFQANLTTIKKPNKILPGGSTLVSTLGCNPSISRFNSCPSDAPIIQWQNARLLSVSPGSDSQWEHPTQLIGRATGP